MQAKILQGGLQRAEPYRVRTVLERITASGRVYKVGEVVKDILLTKDDVPQALEILKS